MKESAREPNHNELTPPAGIAAGVDAAGAAERAAATPGGDSAMEWADTDTVRETFPATRLAEVTSGNSEPRLLLTGVDTLDVGLYVEFAGPWRRIIQRLTQLKRHARAKNTAILGHGRCLLLPGGKPNYPFHLQYPGYQLYLSRKAVPDGETPNVFVSLNSEFLWQQGIEAAVQAVLQELTQLAPCTIRELRISRVDLCADLQLPTGLTVEYINRHLVSRNRKQHAYTDGDKLETIYLGATGADVVLRIYDKSLEIQTSGKHWFLPLWELAENVGVWRFEFQLNRGFLRTVSVNSLDDLRLRAGEVWRYLTEDWCSLRLPDAEHVSRRTLLPLWETIQGCADRFGPVLGNLDRKPRLPSADPHANLKMMAAQMVGFAARNQLTSLEETLSAVGQALREEFQERDFTAECQRKAIQLGLDPTREAA